MRRAEERILGGEVGEGDRAAPGGDGEQGEVGLEGEAPGGVSLVGEARGDSLEPEARGESLEEADVGGLNDAGTVGLEAVDTLLLGVPDLGGEGLMV